MPEQASVADVNGNGFSGSASAKATLTETQWERLLGEIHNRNVIPIVGPEIVTIDDPRDGVHKTLYSSMAAQLAEMLNLPPNRIPFRSLNEVACHHLLGGRSRREIYPHVSTLLEALGKNATSVPPALADLASIADFDLFISGSIDPLLGMALERHRPNFRRDKHVLAYDYKRAVDLPGTLDPAIVYHLVGNRSTHPNFAV